MSDIGFILDCVLIIQKQYIPVEIRQIIKSYLPILTDSNIYYVVDLRH